VGGGPTSFFFGPGFFLPQWSQQKNHPLGGKQRFPPPPPLGALGLGGLGVFFQSEFWVPVPLTSFFLNPFLSHQQFFPLGRPSWSGDSLFGPQTCWGQPGLNPLPPLIRSPLSSLTPLLFLPSPPYTPSFILFYALSFTSFPHSLPPLPHFPPPPSLLTPTLSQGLDGGALAGGFLTR